MHSKHNKIDITNPILIELAIYDCIKAKHDRSDTRRWLGSVFDDPPDKMKLIIDSKDDKLLFIVPQLVKDIQKSLINHDVKLPEPKFFTIIDRATGKERLITNQHIIQHVYDYIAVAALKPILKRIGEYQVASIKGRGHLYGLQAIKKWVREPRMRYAAKMDIRKC